MNGGTYISCVRDRRSKSCVRKKKVPLSIKTKKKIMLKGIIESELSLYVVLLLWLLESRWFVCRATNTYGFIWGLHFATAYILCVSPLYFSQREVKNWVDGDSNMSVCAYMIYHGQCNSSSVCLRTTTKQISATRRWFWSNTLIVQEDRNLIA